MTRAACATLVLAAVLVACGPPPAATVPKASAGDAFVTIHSNLDDADLVIDGIDTGVLTPKRPRVQLEPGVHQLELRRDDYYSTYAQLRLAPGEHKNIRLDLAQILP